MMVGTVLATYRLRHLRARSKTAPTLMIKSTVTVEKLLEFLEDYLSRWNRALLTERVITLPIGLIGVGVISA